jgi:amidophosphoribosyltransferase
MPTRKELVAYNRTDDEIAHAIGADKVIYQNMQDLIESVSKFNPSIKNFDLSVFSGCYVTGDIDEVYLDRLEKSRSESSRVGKVKGFDSDDVVGLYNNGSRTMK